MNGKIKVGVIGCGVVASTHAENFLKNDGVEVKWACDLAEKKARSLARKYSIEKTATDYRQVIQDPELDCVSVCTDHASHTPIVIDALDAGKHVLCEKALGATKKGMDQMCDAHARNPELVFSGVFQHRFDPALRALRRLVAGGVFGTLLNASVQMRCLRTNEYYRGDKWRGTWAQEGGSLLINQSIHFIDALLWIVGGAEQVCGAHANITHGGVIETEDCAAAALRLKCGALGTIEATASSHLEWEPTISLHGSAGSVEIRDKKPVKLKFEKTQDEETVLRELSGDAGPGPGESSKAHYGTGHPAQIADFLDSVRHERAPFVSGEDARHAVDVVLGIYRSHKTGGWVDINGCKNKEMQAI